MHTKVLILYGFSDWENLSDTRISSYLPNDIKVIQIWELNHLLWYLDSEDGDLKKIILPLQIYKQKELNDNNIKNMYGNSNDAIDVFDNKKLFALYSKKMELTDFVPHLYEKYMDEYNKNYNKVIVKNPNGAFGDGIQIKTLKEINQQILNDFVVQEYIYSNIEYAGHLVVKKGNIINAKIYEKTVNVKENSEYFLNKSYTYIIPKKVTIDNKHINALQNFLLPLKYTGFCCIDFKIKNDKVKVFEINTRLGSTLITNLNDLSDSLLVMINS